MTENINKIIDNEAVELDMNTLESVTGGEMYVEGGQLILCGTTKDGQYIKMMFVNNVYGLEQATKIAQRLGISTEMIKK